MCLTILELEVGVSASIDPEGRPISQLSGFSASGRNFVVVRPFRKKCVWDPTVRFGFWMNSKMCLKSWGC